MKTVARKPTLIEFKQFSKDSAPAVRVVLMARLHAEATRKRVDAYIHPILASYGFVKDAFDGKFIGAGEPITDEGDLYLTQDPRLPEFYAACDRAHREHGFTGPQGHCPALIAGHLVTEAENALIDLAESLFGIESCDLAGDTREKYLDLLIGAGVKSLS